MEKRRQNHSCEQCRKSKKACDGFLVNGSQSSPSDDSVILPCSYCVRTKKECSLNPHWANIQLKNENSGLEDSAAPVDGEPDIKRQRVRSHENANPGIPTPLTGPGEAESLVHLFQNQQHQQHPDVFGWDPAFGMPEGPATTTSTSDSLGASRFDGNGSVNGMESLHQHHNSNPSLMPSHLGNWDFMFDANQHQQHRPPDELPNTGLDCFAIPAIADYASNSNSNPSSFDAQSTSFDLPPVFGGQRGSFSSNASIRQHKQKQKQRLKYDHKQKRHGPQKDSSRYRRDSSHDWQRSNSHSSSSMSLSPFAAAHIAMANSNRNLISESLLRIYHDVLENNLACWLAEDTCPYQMEKRRQAIIPMRGFSPEGQEDGQIQPEWGVAWSNRMYRRVKQLDRVAQATKLINLSRTESHAASKALDLVVMAFATQWAQGSRRKDKFDPAGWCGNGSGFGDDSGEFGDDFEQHLQYSVWEQAKRALQEVSDLECFRVTYAELIFGLIQKPWIVDDYSNVSVPDFGHRDVKSAVQAQITDIIAQGGPPVFLERGARKIHSLKYSFEAQEAGFREIDRLGSKANQAESMARFGVEERRTVGLLYWLGVMFDTISSSMNEKPVIVADEECEHDAAQDLSREETKTKILSRKWELDLYAQENSDQPSPLHWPCPYEDATRAVARSAAVKVLLWRYVSYLQNALRKNEHGQALEEIISVTTSVYRYWNKTHGAFFRDLTRNFDSIPARIKSWFPCIGIPWHLASMMLADLIDFVDDNGLGLPESTAERLDTNMAMRIRRSSATELADLAVVASPQDMDAMNTNSAQAINELQDFHFAVSDSPLLTEPWTILLVRAFAKAAVFHLGEAEDLRRHERSVLGHEGDEFQASVRRGQSCVKALWFLGTKSEMAKAITKVLARPLHSYESGMSPDVTMMPGVTV